MMTEADYLRMMLRNCDVSEEIERETMLKCEARIDMIDGYRRAFTNRLNEVDKPNFTDEQKSDMAYQSKVAQ